LGIIKGILEIIKDISWVTEDNPKDYKDFKNRIC